VFSGALCSLKEIVLLFSLLAGRFCSLEGTARFRRLFSFISCSLNASVLYLSLLTHFIISLYYCYFSFSLCSKQLFRRSLVRTTFARSLPLFANPSCSLIELVLSNVLLAIFFCSLAQLVRFECLFSRFLCSLIRPVLFSGLLAYSVCSLMLPARYIILFSFKLCSLLETVLSSTLLAPFTICHRIATISPFLSASSNHSGGASSGLLLGGMRIL
jgi:hypothetical protein